MKYGDLGDLSVHYIVFPLSGRKDPAFQPKKSQIHMCKLFTYRKKYNYKATIHSFSPHYLNNVKGKRVRWCTAELPQHVSEHKPQKEMMNAHITCLSL